MIKIIYTKNLSAQEIMDLDKKMLDELTEDSLPILHFYKWKNPTITYGYFIDPKKYLNLDAVNDLNIDLARRPTGGGIVFHLWDMAFSFLLPSGNKYFSVNTLKNYHFVNSCILAAVEEYLRCEKSPNAKENIIKLTKDDFLADGIIQKNFCMARPTKYDVIIENKKVAGAAQRKKKNGYLHQGTIALSMPEKEILEKILIDKTIIYSMYENTYPLFKTDSFLAEEKIDLLRDILKCQFEKLL